ncbi:MAG: T9SS type A sorting domain-containing protein [Calditrichota bacterium]
MISTKFMLSAGLQMILLAMLISPLTAQVPDTLWTGLYGGANEDYARAVVQTSDGGFAVTGDFGRVSGEPDSGDVWLLKVSPSGNEQWSKSYGGNKLDRGYALVQLPDDGFLVAGETSSRGNGLNDLWVLRTNSSGDTLWTRTYGGAGTEFAEDLKLTSDGGFTLLSATRSFGAGGLDCWLLRCDANGDTLWTKSYGGTANDFITSVEVTSDGGYAIIGSTFSFGEPGQPDMWLVRTDANGDTLWTTIYNGPHYPWSTDAGNFVKETSDGGFLLLGNTNGLPNTTNRDIWLIRTDANGDTLWTQSYGGTMTEDAVGLVELQDGGYMIAGSSLDNNGDQALVICTNATGDSLWDWRMGDTNSEQIWAIAPTTDNSAILAGYTSNFNANVRDGWLIRFEGDSPTAIGDPETSELPGTFHLEQNYPNPFNPTTTIRYFLPAGISGPIALEIVDIRGSVIATLNAPGIAGWNEAEWNGLNKNSIAVSSGVYFYRLRVENQSAVKKLMLVR